MTASTYITLDEVKAALNIPSDDSSEDSALSGILASAARAVDAYCDRFFGQTATATARMYQPYGRVVITDDLVSISAVEYDPSEDGDTWTAISTSDVALGPANAATMSPARPYTSVRAKSGASWPSEYGWVRITGVWGWPAVPQQIKDATLKQAVRLYVSKDVPLGVIGGADTMSFRLPGGLHPDARLLCDPFVRVAI